MGGLSLQLVGFLAVFALAISVVMIARLKAAVLVYAGMLGAAALAVPVDANGNIVTSWLLPVQTRRSELFVGCGCLMLLAMLFHFPRLRVSRISSQGIVMLLVALYVGFVRIVASPEPMDGIQTMLFALATVLPGVVLLPALLETDEDLFRALRVIALVSALWAMACAVQFAVRPVVLTLGGGFTRFQGMLSNPQHAGVYLAVMTWNCLFLLLNDTKLRYRPLWIGLGVVNGVMLLWTGSRTGLGMMALGSTALLYARAGRAILILPVAGALFAVAFNFVAGTLGGTIGLSVLSGRGDTRSGAWLILWEQFLANPLFGTGSQGETKYSENSILFGLAAYGIGMGVLLLILMLVTAGMALRLIRARAWLTPLERRFTDLFIGYSIMHFAGSMFEGYLVSRVSAPLVFMLLFSAVGPFLLERAQQRKLQAEWSGGEPPDLDDTQSAQDQLSETSYAEFGDFSTYGSETGSGPALSDSAQR